MFFVSTARTLRRQNFSLSDVDDDDVYPLLGWPQLGSVETTPAQMKNSLLPHCQTAFVLYHKMSKYCVKRIMAHKVFANNGDPVHVWATFEDPLN